jgi:hypothetical protein
MHHHKIQANQVSNPSAINHSLSTPQKIKKSENSFFSHSLNKNPKILSNPNKKKSIPSKSIFFFKSLSLKKEKKKKNGTQRPTPAAATPLHLLLLLHSHHHQHPITPQWPPATSSPHRLNHPSRVPLALPSFNGTLNHGYSDRRRSTSGGNISKEKEREAQKVWDS